MILSGLTYHYYSIGLSQEATINNMRGQAIVAWARQMDAAAYYINNTRTNIDMYNVYFLLRSISDTALTVYISDGTLYIWMSSATDRTADSLGAYAEGAPHTVRNISPTAISMIQTLAQKIQNTTRQIIGSTGPWMDLTHLSGEDPTKLLEEKGILDSVINGCTEIGHLSQQILDIEPKFQ